MTTNSSRERGEAVRQELLKDVGDDLELRDELKKARDYSKSGKKGKRLHELNRNP